LALLAPVVDIRPPNAENDESKRKVADLLVDNGSINGFQCLGKGF
jgi:hypothetical protein